MSKAQFGWCCFWVVVGVVLGNLLIRGANADRYYASPIGVWIEANGSPGRPPTEWKTITKPGDTILIDGAVKTPGPEPGPTPGTLTDRTYARAKPVNEPVVADGLAKTYQQASQQLTAGMTWVNVQKQIDAFNALVIKLTSQKPTEWEAVIAATDKDLADEPQTAATLLQVSAGFAKAGEGAAINIDWMCVFASVIKCLGFGGSPTLAPTPDLQLQSVYPPASNTGINRLFDQLHLGGTPLEERKEFVEVK